jgi:hypothetical protein
MGFGDGSYKGTASNFMKISEKCDEDPGKYYTSVRGRNHETYTDIPVIQTRKFL